MQRYVLTCSESSWGDAVTEEQNAALCRVAEGWLSDHEGAELCIECRPCYPGEVAALYGVRANGDLQILGYSVDAEDDVRDLTEQAWQYACDNAPEGF
jgi:hypothetical protein